MRMKQIPGESESVGEGRKQYFIPQTYFKSHVKFCTQCHPKFLLLNFIIISYTIVYHIRNYYYYVIKLENIN